MGAEWQFFFPRGGEGVGGFMGSGGTRCFGLGFAGDRSVTGPTHLNIGIFHRKAAKVAKERKEVGKSGGKAMKWMANHTAIPTLTENNLRDPLRPLRLCGKSDAFLMRRP
jgi:hypothetical protein